MFCGLNGQEALVPPSYSHLSTVNSRRFTKKVTWKDVELHRISLRDKDMKTANCELDPDCVPANAAYYSQGYSGVLNFTKIATFPYYASMPHFLHADDYYVSSLSGLDPQACSCTNN